MPLNYANTFDPVLRDVRAGILELCEMKAGDRVIDVCCGTGDQAFYYAQKGAMVVGIDRNRKSLEISQSRMRTGLNNVFFCQASATELPFPDGYFDFASITLGLHEMNRSQRALTVSEMKRVVKKTGTLILVDFKVPLPGNWIGYFIRSIEFVVGTQNFRCFRDYIARGGLDSILRENRLNSEAETLLKRNCIKIVKSRNVQLSKDGLFSLN
jgi:ubiquinone/menaquinone biosynthesis C-methylase UbiE